MMVLTMVLMIVVMMMVVVVVTVVMMMLVMMVNGKATKVTCSTKSVLQQPMVTPASAIELTILRAHLFLLRISGCCSPRRKRRQLSVELLKQVGLDLATQTQRTLNLRNENLREQDQGASVQKTVWTV